jgi:hypothetical protein
MSHPSPSSFNLALPLGNLSTTTVNPDSQPIHMENIIITWPCLQDATLIKKPEENYPKPSSAQANPKPLWKGNPEKSATNIVSSPQTQLHVTESNTNTTKNQPKTTQKP